MLIAVNTFLGVLTILAQILLACLLFGWIFLWQDLKALMQKMPSNRGLILAFSVATVATAGSLFYSQVALFVPCQLCWFQRIFMYPQVILLGLALIKKDHAIIDYSLALGLVGMLISLYHNFIIYFPGAAPTVCNVGGQISCVQLIILSFGYISIPLMALTAFLLLNCALLWVRFSLKVK